MSQREVVEKGFKLLEEVFMLPLVTWPGYEDNVPEALKEGVLPERLAQVMMWSKNEGDDDCVDETTDVETLIYLYTASLATPLR